MWHSCGNCSKYETPAKPVGGFCAGCDREGLDCANETPNLWRPMTPLDTPIGSGSEPITDDTAVVEVTRDSSSIPIKERGCGNCANKDNPLWRCEVCSPLNRNGLDYPTQWEPIPTPKSCDDCALYNGSYGEIDCAECVNKSEWVENIWLSENLPPEIKPSNIEDRRPRGETETNHQCATLTETQQLIRQKCEELASFLVEKNRAYGDSVIHPSRIFSKADATEQIKVRIDDKLNRMMKGTEFDGDDTVLDLVGYLILLLVAKER